MAKNVDKWSRITVYLSQTRLVVDNAHCYIINSRRYLLFKQLVSLPNSEVIFSAGRPTVLLLYSVFEENDRYTESLLLLDIILRVTVHCQILSGVKVA